MGLVPSIQSLSQLDWPGGTAGQNVGASKSDAGRTRDFSPPGAETPEEALAYIQQLYQDGRTDELVGLLRSKPVFREAWQTLQQAASSGSEETGALASPPPDQSTLPVPSPGNVPASQLPSPSQDLSAAQVTATQEFSPEIQAGQNYPIPALKPSRPLAAGRQVYEDQALYFAQEKADFPRINIRI